MSEEDPESVSSRDLWIYIGKLTSLIYRDSDSLDLG